MQPCRFRCTSPCITEISIRLATRFSFVLVVLAAVGCTGTPLRLPSAPLQPNEEVIGPVHGNCTGIMLFGFIPIDQNDRFEDAYHEAFTSVNGATRIMDATIQEDWWWGYIMNGYNFHFSGTAVRTK